MSSLALETTHHSVKNLPANHKVTINQEIENFWIKNADSNQFRLFEISGINIQACRQCSSNLQACIASGAGISQCATDYADCIEDFCRR